MFSPTIITTTKAAWNRRATDRTPPVNQNINAQVGLNGVDQSIAGVDQFNLTGFRGLGRPVSGNQPAFRIELTDYHG